MLEHKIKSFFGKSVVGVAAVLGLAGCGDNVTNNYYGTSPKDTTIEIDKQNEDTINVKPETVSFYDTELKVDAIISPEIGNSNDIPKDILFSESTPIDAFDVSYDILETILGCTDPKAENYNPQATKDDGTCYYLTTGSGSDLKDYPVWFVTDGVFNGYLVVGENAKAIDNLSAIDIAAGMKYIGEDGQWHPVAIIDALKLDSEIANYKAQNLIVIGNPCYNTISAALLGNPVECASGFTVGVGLVKLFENGDKVAMLVAGYSGEDTRVAAKFVANKWKELSGKEVHIETASGNIIPIPW